MLDLNVTMLFQLINFFIALYVINLLIVRPVRELVKKRDALMNDLAGEADGFHEEAVRKLNDYEAQLNQARRQAGQTREESKNSGLEELRSIVESARKSARETLAENRENTRRQAEEALAKLRDGIDDFSTKMGEKLMGD